MADFSAWLFQSKAWKELRAQPDPFILSLVQLGKAYGCFCWGALTLRKVQGQLGKELP